MRLTFPPGADWQTLRSRNKKGSIPCWLTVTVVSCLRVCRPASRASPLHTWPELSTHPLALGRGGLCTLSGTIASVESYLCRKSSVNCSALQRCIVRKVCHPFEFGTILLPKKQCYCFTEYFAHSACRTCTCGKYFMAIGQDFGGKELLFSRALHVLIQGNTSFLHVRHLDS
jgi:hypothetical protein